MDTVRDGSPFSDLNVYLAELDILEGQFCLLPASRSDVVAEKMWLVVKCFRSQRSGYRLCEGDIIKLGKSQFLVKEMRSSDELLEDFSMNELIFGEQSEGSDDSVDENYEIACRVCLSGKVDPSNPLVSPCICGGTMKYIHIKCLQNSLKSRLINASSSVAVTISWNKLHCDLCKKKFPQSISIGKKKVSLIEFAKPPGSYIILENAETPEKALHLISFVSQTEVTIGRNAETDLKINDMSVSRTHAKIVHENGRFVLEDLNSKFGTLIKVGRPIVIEQYSPLTVQTGRTVLTLTYCKGWSLIPGCFTSRPSPFELTDNPIVNSSFLLPIGTGIPLSVSNQEQLMERLSISPRQSVKYLGTVNSSSEYDNEEVEVAPNQDMDVLVTSM